MNKAAVAALSFVAARSRRLRRLVPFLPIAIALYEVWRSRRAPAAAATSR